MSKTESTAARLQVMLDRVPSPGMLLLVDDDMHQLLRDLHAHFAAAEDMIKKGEELCK